MGPRIAERFAPRGGAASAVRTWTFQWRWIAVVCVTVAGVIGIDRLTAGPAFVPKVTVVNASPYATTVEDTGATRDGWTTVTIADPRATTTAEQVIDQGATWTFRFSAQGQNGGEVTLTRNQLERTGWQVRIPVDVQQQLEKLGSQPTP